MPPIILMVSFGTVNSETRKKSIDAVAQTLQQAYPQFELRQAFTSSMVTHRLAKQGILMDDVPTALENLKQQGCKQLYILPTHLFPGEEYHKFLSQLEPFRDAFPQLSVANPLLCDDHDRKAIASFLQKNYALSDEEALLLMAHGSEHDIREHYLALDSQLKRHSSQMFLAAMEGEPAFEAILSQLLEQGFRKVKLLPLMLSAGAHAVKDMAGEQESSWKNCCLSAGLETDCILTGLGEAAEIRQLYLHHLKNIIDG